MKSKNTGLKRGLALLLVLITVLSFVSCQGDTSIKQEETTPYPVATTRPDLFIPEDPITFVPSKVYTLIYPQVAEGSDILSGALTSLSKAMKAVYGIDVTSVCDSTLVESSSQDTYEILIGDTNRPQSQLAMNGLGVRDYTYLVESENTIVICGGTLSATQTAVEEFCAGMLGYRSANDYTENTPVVIGATCTKRETYPYAGITLNGASLSDWTIMIDPKDKTVDLADEMVHLFGYYTGARMNVSTAISINKNVIVLGGIGRTKQKQYGVFGEYYRVATDATGCVVSLFSTEDVLPILVDYMTEQLVVEKQEKSVVLTLPQVTLRNMISDAEVSTWKIQSDIKKNLYDGVRYIEQIFEDEKGKPYRTYALFLDPDKISFSMGSANDGYTLAPVAAERQTTQEHMSALAAKGRNIIAGINANFFLINSDYSPRGLALKNGILINTPGADMPFLAVTEDGEVIIDEADTFYTYANNGKKFIHGVAGNEILLKDGMLTHAALYGDQSVHPRTLAGIAEDGTIILGVIDGRQATLSNGAGYARCALWMRSLGARTVINLDGGGSSNLILRDPLTDHYDVRNSPSDGNLRKIYNSWLVELKS